ncbi:hypothetical protein AVEN_246992-1 [Araneus ventricosus]|uniref:Uncharacterized protein n=1 Tax=Araneus ventricosus TaxID=182803 RepID=A0A4Y2UNL2_ARAVE|nr:hypothetical protein AVEN_246992-1 [Araneus ventricosus]
MIPSLLFFCICIDGLCVQMPCGLRYLEVRSTDFIINNFYALLVCFYALPCSYATASAFYNCMPDFFGMKYIISDIITSLPNNDMCKTLKERLINIFSDSEECLLKKLLQDVELGDKRPSMLLRKMKDLAGNCVGDELLRSLWLQRLPTQMQAILTTSSDDLNKLSVMADKIADVTSPHQG